MITRNVAAVLWPYALAINICRKAQQEHDGNEQVFDVSLQL
jgi:hypothetical protein